jgi:hypothetical protein
VKIGFELVFDCFYVWVDGNYFWQSERLIRKQYFLSGFGPSQLHPYEAGFCKPTFLHPFAGLQHIQQCQANFPLNFCSRAFDWCLKNGLHIGF